MKHLLNTLYVLSEDSYLSLNGENVVVSQGENQLGRFPLHTLENILCFSYKGGSPALLGACVKRGIHFCFFTPNGRFLARVCGETSGSVLLRQQQSIASMDPVQTVRFAKNLLMGKVYNSRWVLERATRDHPQRVPVEALKASSRKLQGTLLQLQDAESLNELMGLEGEAAQTYFSRMDALILQQKEAFSFSGRSRRPPMDRVNAALSFAYSLLAHECASALEGVGLDPYVGFLHRPRPGRASLALDLEEELRSVYADRFVLSCINRKQLQPGDFDIQESGAVLLNDKGRRAFLSAWQERRKETIRHPFLGEKMEWGLVPSVQAMLLARTLRGDLEEYPPFLWK